MPDRPRDAPTSDKLKAQSPPSLKYRPIGFPIESDSLQKLADSIIDWLHQAQNAEILSAI